MFRDSKVTELLNVIAKGGVWTSEDLAKELGVDKRKISLLVKKVRYQFLKGTPNVPYIFTTGVGYSLDEKPEYTAYESKMRMQMGYGILINGSFVFKRCKQIAPKMFESLNITFKPKMLTVARLIQK